MTLQQIRNQLRLLLNESDETNTHFTDNTELNSFINQAVNYLAVLIEHPRDFVSVSAEKGAGIYTLLTDTLLIRTAYFGDVNVKGDSLPLEIISEETLKELHPSWRDETTDSEGRPRYLILLNKRQIFVYPRPDTAESASGKKIELNYVFAPASMSADGDTPELPTPYHNILQHYAASLAYFGKLQNPTMGKEHLGIFAAKVKSLENTLTKETTGGMNFQWGYSDDLGDNQSSVSDLRLS